MIGLFCEKMVFATLQAGCVDERARVVVFTDRIVYMVSFAKEPYKRDYLRG